MTFFNNNLYYYYMVKTVDIFETICDFAKEFMKKSELKLLLFQNQMGFIKRNRLDI